MEVCRSEQTHFLHKVFSPLLEWSQGMVCTCAKERLPRRHRKCQRDVPELWLLVCMQRFDTEF